MSGMQVTHEKTDEPKYTQPMLSSSERLELLETIGIEAEKKIRQATEEAIYKSERMAKESFKRLRTEIEGLRPTVGILKVEVNNVRKTLSRPASPVLGRLILNAKLGLNSLLVGPAGCGKTTAAEQLAESLDLEFGHLGLTAGASETWLFGRQTPIGFVEAAFSRIYKNGGVFLADEMDAADPNLLLAINTALANNSMYNPILGEQIPKHKDFVFVGAMNTNGRGSDGIYAGRNRLDAATLDRFVLMKVDYDEGIERNACPDEDLREKLQRIRTILGNLKSPEVVSTRALARAYAQHSNGISVDDILGSLFMGWPQSIVEQVKKKLS